MSQPNVIHQYAFASRSRCGMRVVLGLALLLLLLTSPILASPVQSQQCATMGFSPTTVSSAQVGDIILLQVPMDAGGVTFDAVGFLINFDQAFLQVVDVAGNPTSQIEAGDLPGAPVINTASNINGTIEFSHPIVGGQTSGTFTVATIRFKVMANLPVGGTQVTFVNGAGNTGVFLAQQQLLCAFPGPATITPPTQPQLGSISITKDTVPNGAQDFNFTTTGGLTPATFTLDDDADATLPSTQTYIAQAVGPYTVTETADAGFTTTVACNDPDNGTTTVGNTANIDLDADETVTCTFTNTAITQPQTGTIIITKDTVPNGPQDFNFTTTGGLAPAAFTLDDDADATLPNTQTYNGQAVNAYTVTETADAGFTTTVACNDPDNGTTTVGNTANIDLDADETVTCTFTNTFVPPLGTITVVKTVVGQAPADVWQFTGNLGTFTLPAGGGNQIFPNLNAGNFTITETAKPNYTAAVTCDSGENGTNSVTVNLAAGENVTCTFTNTFVPPPAPVPATTTEGLIGLLGLILVVGFYGLKGFSVSAKRP